MTIDMSLLGPKPGEEQVFEIERLKFDNEILRAENERLRKALEFIHAEADKKVLSDKKADLRSALILIDEASSEALKGKDGEHAMIDDAVSHAIVIILCGDISLELDGGDWTVRWHDKGGSGFSLVFKKDGQVFPILSTIDKTVTLGRTADAFIAERERGE